MGKGPSGGAGAPVNSTVVRTAEEKTAEYAVFALVPVFCIMGLLGILICNILKKKGYRCSADKEGGDEETATPQKEGKMKSFQFYSAECLNSLNETKEDQSYQCITPVQELLCYSGDFLMWKWDMKTLPSTHPSHTPDITQRLTWVNRENRGRTK